MNRSRQCNNLKQHKLLDNQTLNSNVRQYIANIHNTNHSSFQPQAVFFDYVTNCSTNNCWSWVDNVTKWTTLPSNLKQPLSTKWPSPTTWTISNSGRWQYSKTQRYESLLCQIRGSSCRLYDQPQQLGSILKSQMVAVSWQRPIRKINNIIPINY